MHLFVRVYKTLRFKYGIKFRPLIPACFLMVYSILGALLFFGVEHNQSCAMSFWEALYFASAIYTTIGNGTMQVCSHWGRLCAVLYALLGIPLALITLDGTGNFFAGVANMLWTRFRSLSCVRRGKCSIKGCCRCCKRNEMKSEIMYDIESQVDTISQHSRYPIAESKPRSEPTVIEPLPLPLSFFVIFAWLLLMSGIFTVTEKNWRFGEALYFVMIQVTTVGFGDIPHTQYQFTLLYQLLTIIGLTLFSLCINLVQQHIQNLENGIIRKIERQYANRIADDEEEETQTRENSGDAGDRKSNSTDMTSDTPGSALPRKREAWTAKSERRLHRRESLEEEVDDMIKKDGKYLRFLMGNSARQHLVSRRADRDRMVNVRVQTKVRTSTTACQTDPDRWKYAASRILAQVRVVKHLKRKANTVGVQTGESVKPQWKL